MAKTEAHAHIVHGLKKGEGLTDKSRTMYVRTMYQSMHLTGIMLLLR